MQQIFLSLLSLVSKYRRQVTQIHHHNFAQQFVELCLRRDCQRIDLVFNFLFQTVLVESRLHLSQFVVKSISFSHLSLNVSESD